MPVTLPDYNINPSPQAGAGPYGAVPGAITIPPNLWEQVSAVAPGLTGLTPDITRYVGREVAGQLTTPEQKALQDAAAAWGVGAGQPLTNPYSITTNKWDTSRLVETMNREKQGLADYASLIQGISGLQTPQTLAADIASRNATMAAAPNPAQAFQAMLDAWMQKFNAMLAAQKELAPNTGTTGLGPRQRTTASPPIVGSPATGTGVYAPPTSGSVTYAGGVATPPPTPTSNTPAGELSDWEKRRLGDDVWAPWDVLGRMDYGDLWQPVSPTVDTLFPELTQPSIGNVPAGSVYDFFTGGTTPDQPFTWDLEGTPFSDLGYGGATDVEQFPGWYEDVGYYDMFGE